MVVGAGIAGLACAAALARRGVRVTVLERAREITEVGAGIQVTPNGFRVLRALGLEDAALAASLRAEAVEPHDALSGRRLARFALPPGYRLFHRADLIDLLARAAQGATLRLGARVASADAGCVMLEDCERLTASLVVGADGLRSVVRAGLNGADAPFFTGQVAWRAVVAGDQPPAARVWMAPGRHVVTYPLPGGRINVVAVREEVAWSAEGWHHLDDPSNLRAAFADAAPTLAAILARVESTHRWGLFRHPVAARWQDGARALLGDAAHPTLPFLAQGANLALEDAWVLARHAGNLPAYEALRRPRVVRAIEAANANARAYHLRGLRRRVAHLGLRALDRVAPGAFLRRLDWLYGFDATA